MNAGKACIQGLPLQLCGLFRRCYALILTVGVLLPILSACSMPSNQHATATADQEMLTTLVAQTLSVYPTTRQSTATPSWTPPPASPTSTPDVLPTAEFTETQSSPTISPSSTKGAQPIESPSPYTQLAGPSFSASFSQWNFCNDRQTVIFRVKNTGGVPFESMGLTIKIPATGINLKDQDRSNKPFMSSKDVCPPGAGQLPPGKIAFIGTSLNIPVAILQLRAVITLCTAEGLRGDCLTQTVNFRIK